MKYLLLTAAALSFVVSGCISSKVSCDAPEVKAVKQTDQEAGTLSDEIQRQLKLNKSLNILVKGEQNYYIGSKAVSLEDIANLKSKYSVPDNSEIIINAESNVPFKAVNMLMNKLALQKFSKLSIKNLQ